MDAKKMTFIMAFTLLVICLLIEGKGLCQYAEMFPPKGSKNSIQRKTTKGEKDNVIMQSPVQTTTVQQETSAIVTPETNGSTLPFTQSVIMQSPVKAATMQQETSVFVTPETNGFTLPSTPSLIMQSQVKTITVQQETSAIVSLETNGSTFPSTLSPLTEIECPVNMVYGNCSCPFSCDDPTGRRTSCECMELETCVCADGFLKEGDSCVTPSTCGCYISEVDLVIPNNETYINAACDEKCICQDDQLICNSNYECSPYAECSVLEGVGQCHCNEGYYGDGEECISYKDCYDIFQAGSTQDGVYTIKPAGWLWPPFEVFCDMTTSEGGWTVFQRRLDGITDFNRSWTSYKTGFGSVHNGSDFWLGNSQLYHITITNQRIYKLRIDIITPGGSAVYEEYASFRITGADIRFQLFDLGSHSGTAGNIMSNAVGGKFSTYDQDNDGCDLHNCAEKHGGGWWHTNFWCSDCSNTTCHQFRYSSACTTQCTTSNLNGDYNGGDGEMLFWRQDQYCNLTSVEMKLRPIV